MTSVSRTSATFVLVSINTVRF